ncbi:MAG: SNF2-related protein [Acidobacteriota bacterium]
MKSIRLLPVRRTAPVCSDFESAEAVVMYEREVRRHRAYSEPFIVTPRDDRIDGCYEVAGASGGAYLVDVVDGSHSHDTCSCPDFLSNELGTCKHLEAVSRALTSIPRPRRAWQQLPQSPLIPTLTVDARGRIRLRTAGRWTRQQLDALGLTTGGDGGFVEWEAPVSPDQAWNEHAVRVVHAVMPAVERIRARARTDGRRDGLLRALVDGRIGVDVLARPLFPYQHDGVKHLASSGRALLADDMGLGKTVQAIAACEVLRARGEVNRVVVVTPASLKHQWAKEIERYANVRAAVVGGGLHGRRAAFESDAPYKVLNYELTWKELPRLQDLDTDILILDEAQRAKNFRTKTAKTLRAIPSRFLFVLTGTPIENRLDDLYSLLQLIDPEVLGPLWRFNLDFHHQNDKGKIIGCKNLSSLRKRVEPVVLRRRKEEVLSQLPSLTEQTRYTPLTKEQADLESAYRADAARLMAIAERRPLRPDEQKKLQALLLKARQACNALELCDPASRTKASPKLDEFEALISEIASQGESKVLVFSEWVQMLNLAADRLDGQSIGYAMLHGGVPTDKRPALLDRFRRDDRHRVLLSTDAGGVGLNLQVANYVVHLDLPWNPGRLDQRTSRAHRLGQTRGVFATYLCSESGIERGIEQTLSRKREIRTAALDQSSDVESVETASFSVFLRQLHEVLEQVAEPGEDVEIVGTEEETRLQEPVEAVVEPAAQAQIEARPQPESHAVLATGEIVVPMTQEPARQPAPLSQPRAHARAQNRIRLARVVLDAGFWGDAVRASYEALAAAIATRTEGAPPQGHAALVACIYRDLIPSGRLPHAAPSALARLHDLTTLETQGVEVDESLARPAVAEAEEWIARLAETA